MLDIAGYYGSKVTVEHVDGFAGEEGEQVKTLLQDIINSGKGSVLYSEVEGRNLTSSEAGIDNALWKGHQWKSIKEGLEL